MRLAARCGSARWLAVALVATLCAAQASAQPSKAKASLFSRVDGDEVRVALQIDIADGWHLYHDELGNEDAVGLPTIVTLSGRGIEWSPVRFPAPHKLDQSDIGGTWIWSHDGTLVLYALGRLGAGARADDIAASIEGLTCEDGGSCIPYAEAVTSRGPGTDSLFTGFPQDLEPARLAVQNGGGGASGFSPGSVLPGVAATRGAGQAVAATQGVPEPTPPDSGAPVRTSFHARIAGDEVRAAIVVDIEDGWHLYHTDLGPDDPTGYPTSVTLYGTGVTWSEVRFPEPERLDQTAIGGGWVWSHEGAIVLYALGSLAPGADGKDLGAKIEGLVCKQSCNPYAQIVADSGPGTDALFAGFPDDLVVGTAVPKSVDARDHAAPAAPGDVDYAAVEFPDYVPVSEQAEHGLGVWLLLAALAGMILNVMPCVLPVISIKILSFVQQAGEDRSRILALGLSFAAGIVTIFLGLAALAAFANLGWGQQFQSQTFLIVMIGIVFAFALSMFGVYELGVPAGVGNLGGGTVRREGLVDAYFKGMLATVLATPCSGPFLGSTLTWTLGQSTLVIFGIFLSLGLGMALPYVVLTANPKLLKVVPKPGPWMDTFKHSMGFVLMATVVYLMVSLHQDYLLYTVAFLVFVALGCWWWGRFANLQQGKAKRLATLAMAVLIVAGGAHLTFRTMRSAFQGDEGRWVEFEPERFFAELEAGRSVFVDFTATWCPNCKWNEFNVFDSEEVRAALASKDVLAMKADLGPTIASTNPRTDMLWRFMATLGSRSIPFMAVFPGDDPLRPVVRPDIVSKAEMLTILNALP